MPGLCPGTPIAIRRRSMSETPEMGPEKRRKRPKRVNVRFTEEEYSHLLEKANIVNKRPASFARAILMGEPMKAVPRFPQDVQRAIKSFDPNLNQLAHQSNMGRVDKREVDALRDSVNLLLEKLGVR